MMIINPNEKRSKKPYFKKNVSIKFNHVENAASVYNRNKLFKIHKIENVDSILNDIKGCLNEN